jgi:hypothetical protein
MDWKDYFGAVEKWEKGEQLDEREARMVAYGWTAGTCGQRVRSNDTVKVKVAEGRARGTVKPVSSAGERRNRRRHRHLSSRDTPPASHRADVREP